MEEHWVPEEGAGQDLVQRLHQEGLAGPLRWLQNCLRRAAGDREEDGEWGGVGGGSCGESFWRIPAALTPRQLRRAAASIAHRGPSGSPQHLPEPPRCPQEPAAGEGRGWGCGTPGCGAGSEPPSLCPSAEPLPAALGSDSESEEPGPVPVPSPAQPRTKRRRELASEDEDEDGGSSGGFSPSARSWG
ncbi:TIM protein, partial [Sitta europaea]|nr:TIM protein [Sitta europaea]